MIRQEKQKDRSILKRITILKGILDSLDIKLINRTKKVIQNKAMTKMAQHYKFNKYESIIILISFMNNINF
jgi:hypothetical protein